MPEFNSLRTLLTPAEKSRVSKILRLKGIQHRQTERSLGLSVAKILCKTLPNNIADTIAMIKIYLMNEESNKTELEVREFKPLVGHSAELIKLAALREGTR